MMAAALLPSFNPWSLLLLQRVSHRIRPVFLPSFSVLHLLHSGPQKLYCLSPHYKRVFANMRH